MVVTDCIPCLSLWQPWAQLVCIGQKDNETRSWKTKYRGKVMIHAGLSRAGDFALKIPTFQLALKDQELIYGAIIGTAEIVSIHHTIDVVTEISEKERAFGDYSENRFAWKLRNASLFLKPIPCKGGQLLFDVRRKLNSDGLNKLEEYGIVLPPLKTLVV